MAKWQVVRWREVVTGIELSLSRPVKGKPSWRASRGDFCSAGYSSPGQALQALWENNKATLEEAEELGATPLPGVNPGDASLYTQPCATLEVDEVLA